MIMTCRRFAELTAAQLVLEPSAGQRLGQSLHRLMCQNCRRFARQIAHLDEILLNHAESPRFLDDMPTEVLERLRTRLTKPDKPL
jgi:predicted anti-sigma-YlaC factor YlaD